MKNSKTLLALLLITASSTSFLAGYVLTQGSRDKGAVLQEQRGMLIDRFNGVPDTATPTPLPPGLLQAVPQAVLAPANAFEDDSVLYYQADNGYVSSLDLETRSVTLVSTTAPSRLARVIWSPNKNRVITVSQTNTGFKYSYFDYVTREHGDLGPDIQDVVFSPDSDKIALVRAPGGESAIQIADFDGKNIRTLLKTRLLDIHVSWPSPETLSFTALDTLSNTKSLYVLGTSGDLSRLIEGEDGLTVRWSPDGSRFLYSTQGSGATTTHMFTVASKRSQKLPINAASHQCAWKTDQQAIVCAIQTGGETSIIRISTIDNSTSVLFSHLIITPREVFLSNQENFLIMTSAADSSLWAVKLH